MRSFIRLRTLAAASALAVFFAVSATAAVSKMPDIPTPVEVGEPDTGQGLAQYFRDLMFAASLSNPVLRNVFTPRYSLHAPILVKRSKSRGRR